MSVKQALSGRRMIASILVVLPLALLYYPLWKDLWQIPVFGHTSQGLGPAAVLSSLALIWQKRYTLKTLPKEQDGSGWWLLVAGGILALVAHRLTLHFPLAVSLSLFLAGWVWCLLGRAWITELWFPLLLLVAMTRLPADASKAFLYPLQILVSHFATVVLDLIGNPIQRAGQLLHVNGQIIRVSEGCSGWRSFTAAFWLALIMAYWQRPSRWWQWFVTLLLFFPAALAANILRVVTVVVFAKHGQAWVLQAPWHELLGLLYFMPVAWLLITTDNNEVPTDINSAKVTDPHDAAILVLPLFNFTKAVFTCWFFALATGGILYQQRIEETISSPPPPPFPVMMDTWHRTTFDSLHSKTAGEWKSWADYRRVDGKRAWVVWQMPFKIGNPPFRVINYWLKQGYEPINMETVVVRSPRRPIPVLVAQLSRGKEQLTVAVTYLSAHRAIASDSLARLLHMAGEFVSGRNTQWVTVAACSPNPHDALEVEKQLLSPAEGWLMQAIHKHTP